MINNERTKREAVTSHHIIDLEDAADSFCSQGQRADGNQERLHHQLFQDVGDSSLSRTRATSQVQQVTPPHTLQLHHTCATCSCAEQMTRRSTKGKRANLANVDAGHLVAVRVSVAELRHSGDGVQACILSKCGGDHLQGVGVRPHTVGLHAPQGL